MYDPFSSNIYTGTGIFNSITMAGHWWSIIKFILGIDVPNIYISSRCASHENLQDNLVQQDLFI